MRYLSSSSTWSSYGWSLETTHGIEQQGESLLVIQINPGLTKCRFFDWMPLTQQCLLQSFLSAISITKNISYHSDERHWKDSGYMKKTILWDCFQRQMTADEAQHQLRFEMACNHNCFPVGHSPQAIRARGDAVQNSFFQFQRKTTQIVICWLLLCLLTLLMPQVSINRV